MAPEETHLVALTRDPYAVVASWAKRTPQRIATEWGWPGSEPRTPAEFYEGLADLWVHRARMLAEALVDCAHHVHYEDFGDRPQPVTAAVTERIPCLAGIDPSRSLRVKNYPASPPVNLNEQQIGTLPPEARGVISRRLAADLGVLDQLGYGPRDTEPQPFV